MAGGDGNKKAIITKSNGENISRQVNFKAKPFNELVFGKGYNVYIDKALRCPCAVKGNGQALPSCNNCIGLGYFYINRKETVIAIQGINAKVQYENWSKLNTGMAKITARSIDRLAFMDRIILLEAEGYYNDIIRAKDFEGKKVCFTTYEIKSVEEIYMFKGDKEKLYPIPDSEYIVENEKIILNNKYKSMTELTISVRYKHLLTYHIIDTNRDLVKVRTEDDCKECADEKKADLPVSYTARKAHYLFDNLNFEQASRLIDNSKDKE